MQITPSIEQMTLDEKMELMDQLWISISTSSGDEVVPVWQREILRDRLKRFEEGNEPSRDAREVIAEIRRELCESRDSQKR